MYVVASIARRKDENELKFEITLSNWSSMNGDRLRNTYEIAH